MSRKRVDAEADEDVAGEIKDFAEDRELPVEEVVDMLFDILFEDED